MKYLITFLFTLLCHICKIYCQEAENSPDTCRTKKPLPCNFANPDDIRIDTISASLFSSKVNRLYEKTKINSELNEDEARLLIEILNTRQFSIYFNQPHLNKKFPKLNFLQKKFDSLYFGRLKCAYTECLGGGFSSYFKELKIQYLGNPYACSRFFILK